MISGVTPKINAATLIIFFFPHYNHSHETTASWSGKNHLSWKPKKSVFGCETSWIGSPVHTHTHTQINSPSNTKSCDNSKTTIGNLSARRIQICSAYFCVVHVDLFFKITFQIMFEQNYTKQIWIRLVKYSCAKISGPSKVPRFVPKLIFKEVKLIYVHSIILRSRVPAIL